MLLVLRSQGSKIYIHNIIKQIAQYMWHDHTLSQRNKAPKRVGGCVWVCVWGGVRLDKIFKRGVWEIEGVRNPSRNQILNIFWKKLFYAFERVKYKQIQSPSFYASLIITFRRPHVKGDVFLHFLMSCKNLIRVLTKSLKNT